MILRTESIFLGHYHWTYAIWNCWLSRFFLGTAPDASFYLFRTKKVNIEVSLEKCLDVDVINVSLGYLIFYNLNNNYSDEDIDGNFTSILRWVEIGTSCGMILLNAAGNFGNSSFKYMEAPFDTAHVFSTVALNI